MGVYRVPKLGTPGPRPSRWDVTVPVDMCPSRHICYVSYFLGSVVVNNILLLPTCYLAKFGRTRPDGMSAIGVIRRDNLTHRVPPFKSLKVSGSDTVWAVMGN